MLLKDFRKDYNWFTNDPFSYEAEQARRDQEFDSQLAIHMGVRFSKSYKLYKEELEDDIKNRIDRINRLKELKAPKVILEGEQEVLGELLNDLQVGNYILTPAEEQYREEYISHREAFNFIFEVNAPEEYK